MSLSQKQVVSKMKYMIMIVHRSDSNQGPHYIAIFVSFISGLENLKSSIGGEFTF